MVATQATVGSFDFGRVVKNTFGVIGRNFGEHLVLAAVLVGIPGALLGWAQFSVSPQLAAQAPSAATITTVLLVGLVGYILTVIGAALLQATVTRVAVADLNGDRASPLEQARKSTSSILPLIGLSFIATLGVVFGMVFLIVPGLILAVLWSVALPVCVVERPGVFASLSRSRNLTRGFRWPIFGLFAVYFIAYLAASTVLGGIAGALMLAGGGGAMVVGTIAASVVTSVAGSMLGLAGVAAIYYELRTAKEGVGADQLAAVFD